MLVAAVCFATMGALVKVGSQTFSTGELVFYRSIFGLIIIGLFIAKRKLPLKTPHIHKQIARGTVGFIALLLFFYAIGHLPLVTAITFNYTSALFLGLLTPLVLNEKPSQLSIIALSVGFLGVVMLLQPQVQQLNWLASMMGLSSGFGAAIAYILVKQLGNENEPDWRTVFYFTSISTIGGFIWSIFDGFHAIKSTDLVILIGLGISATIAQLAMTRAYRTGSTLVVACIGYCTPIIASFLGMIFWQETLTLEAWLAILIIIGSSMLNTIKNQSNSNS